MDLNNSNVSNFKFELNRCPNFTSSVQKVRVPGVMLGSSTTSTPFVSIPLPGNIAFDELSVDFTVSESLGDYLEIFNWMLKTGQPEHLGTQYAPFSENLSDATLVILSNQSNPLYHMKFYDLYPVSLSGLDFDTTVQGIQYIPATATFKFLRYEIVKAT